MSIQYNSYGVTKAQKERAIQAFLGNGKKRKRRRKKMEQKAKYEFEINQDLLARHAAVLEQLIIELCSGCPLALAKTGVIKDNVRAENWSNVESASEWLSEWFGKVHNAAGQLALLYGYAQLYQERNGEKENG